MNFISNFGNVTCQGVTGRSKEEEKELRDSYEVKMSVKNACNAEMKKKNYYRLVSGRPADGAKEGWRRNEWLEETGYFLLDWDYFEKDKNGKPIKKKMNYIDVWNKMKKHTKEWGIVHAEKSARHGLHVTVIRTAGLTIEENIKLMELRSGFTFDHIHDLARACFLVPNDYVIFEDDMYYSDEKPTPLPLFKADWEMLERDKEERRIAHEKMIEERRKSAPELHYGGLTDEVSQLQLVVDLIIKQRIDITYEYDNWIRIGFCISNYLGSAGEDIFHEISRLYPRYEWKETHRVYENLVKTTRHEVSLGSLIHLARLEGVMK